MADNFYYKTGTILSGEMLKTLANEITVLADTKYRWDLHYPAKISDISNQIMLHTVVTDSTDGGKIYDRYLKIYKPPAISLTTSEQTLIDKYNYQGNFSPSEVSVLQKFFSGQNFEITPIDEKSFLKNWYVSVLGHAGSLTSSDLLGLGISSDQAIMNIIYYVKNFQNPNELFLYAKELHGDALTPSEQTALTKYKTTRVLTPEDSAKATDVLNKRGLTKDLAKLSILEYYGEQSSLSSSIGAKDSAGRDIPDEVMLDNYRASRIVSPSEMTQVTAILAKLNANNALMWQIGSEVDTATGVDFIDKKSSVPSRFAWYRHVHSNLLDYTACDYHLTLNKDSLNLVVIGDASLDIYPNNNWLISYAYVGRVLPLDNDSLPDYENNWCMTVSSDIQPAWNVDTSTEHIGALSEKFGFSTANGVTDFAVMGTTAGIPYQAHDVGFYTNNPSRDEVNTQGSRWNKKKHQFSDITLSHRYDMERGKLQNVLVGDASAKADGDRLMFNKKGEDAEMYIKFNITAPYSFMNNSPNPYYCIALRVKVDEFFKNNYCENCGYKEYAVNNGYTGGYNEIPTA